MRSNKKGFTIVELVIVIAVIAILAAVLIPTIAGLVRKANISADTVVAKQLNNAIATQKVDDFEDALAVLRENGYLIANLNTKADQCFFAWDATNKQIVLVDAKNGYEIIYKNKDVDEANLWYAVSDPAIAKTLREAGKNVKNTVSNTADLKAALAAGGEFYMDESVVLDEDNLLEFTTDANVTVNLGASQLTSNGSIDSLIPINIKKGEVTINGGIVGATGTGVDLDGKVYATPINSGKGTVVNINDTQFNGAGDGSPIQFQGEANLKNVKITNAYFYSYGNGNVTLDNCYAEMDNDICIWVTNTITHDDGTYTYDGTSTLTVKSGTYKSGITEANWGAVSVYGGTIKIEGGDFTSADGHMFGILHANGRIEITGGTFNGVSFADLCDAGVDAWKALCAGAYNVVIENNTVTITK